MTFLQNRLWLLLTPQQLFPTPTTALLWLQMPLYLWKMLGAVCVLPCFLHVPVVRLSRAECCVVQVVGWRA
jgi:hypothetical protein